MTKPPIAIDSESDLGLRTYGATIELSLRAAGALLRELSALTLEDTSGLYALRDVLRAMRDTFDGKETP